MKNLKQKRSILIKLSKIRTFEFFKVCISENRVGVRVKRSILPEGTHQLGTTKRKSDLSGVRLKRYFGLIYVGKSKGNEKLVRLSESPTYPGYDLTGFNCKSHFHI